MKLIQENLNEFIMMNSNIPTLNEGLFDDFMANTNPEIRKRILNVMVGGLLALPLGVSLTKIVHDAKQYNVNKAIEEISHDTESTDDEVKEKIFILANYISSAIKEEKGLIKDFNKNNKKADIKKSDKVKRLAPTKYYTLAEIATFDMKDADLVPNKIELKNKSNQGYLKYFKRAIKRGHNAPSNGIVNLKDIRLSNNGVKAIMTEEAYRNYGYNAEGKGNIVTAGFGTAFNPKYQPTGMPYKYNDIVPERKLFVYFYGALEDFEVSVGNVIREGVKNNPNIKYMPQSAVDACISYAYTSGGDGFAKSPLGKALAAGNIALAAKEMRVGNITASGHKGRRQREYEMFIKGFNKKKGYWVHDKSIHKAVDKHLSKTKK